ncbi:DUF1214 domain-containing protein [Erythrobacter ani]|uniref:DUF1214 domain-containing protein n=1 Tax=Erythrobacter ani TaxID=2827235 RepID=A0ABS6SM42_9SPHN|nr:DUF1214 domain-containing protein [Erythrobacter ani]MBV7266113.1 DUF1214 domain-containing protein [Erythrobacter ani]
MRGLLAYGAAIIGGAVIGGFSALSMSGVIASSDTLTGAIEIDGWRGDLNIGSEAADPYTRARIARHGLLALSRSEAIYFTRSVDDSGRPLDAACSYRIGGEHLPARWWSVTLYGADSFLPDNTDEALSFDASQALEMGQKERWSAIISNRRPETDKAWISSKGGGAFDLTLRLYVPTEEALKQPEKAIAAPSIERLACTGGER